MASARDLLERFRPAGTPGAAAPAGVPYDRGAALEDELRPVLALLSPTEERCAAQLREAAAHAEQIRADASVQGAALLAQARLRAEEARAGAAEGLQRRSDEEAAAEIERAAHAAGEVRARARHRLPELTARVVAATRAAMSASEQDRPHPRVAPPGPGTGVRTGTGTGMSARSVGAVVRARAAASRRVGAGRVPSLAASSGLQEALSRLATGPYGHDVRPGQPLSRAQHEVYATVLWNLRVLAGWLPPDGAQAMRLLAGWAEIANVDALLRRFDGEPGPASGVPAGQPRHRLATTGGQHRPRRAAPRAGRHGVGRPRRRGRPRHHPRPAPGLGRPRAQRRAGRLRSGPLVRRRWSSPSTSAPARTPTTRR